MAVLGSVGAAVYRHDIPASAPAAAYETLAVAAQLPGEASRVLTAAARGAFTHGMQAAVAGAVLAEATLRKVALGAAGTASEAAAPEPLAPEKAAGEVTA